MNKIPETFEEQVKIIREHLEEGMRSVKDREDLVWADGYADGTCFVSVLQGKREACVKLKFKSVEELAQFLVLLYRAEVQEELLNR